MAKKKEELSISENPKYLYQLTQKYMLGYVKERGTKEDRIWYAKLGIENQIPITRAGKTFDVLDIKTVREKFADRFFDYLLDNSKKNTKKESYVDQLKKLLEEAEAE